MHGSDPGELSGGGGGLGMSAGAANSDKTYPSNHAPLIWLKQTVRFPRRVRHVDGGFDPGCSYLVACEYIGRDPWRANSETGHQLLSSFSFRRSCTESVTCASTPGAGHCVSYGKGARMRGSLRRRGHGADRAVIEGERGAGALEAGTGVGRLRVADDLINTAVATVAQ